MKNKIFFRFDLLEDDKNELYNDINKTNNKNNNPQKENANKNKSSDIGIIKKVSSLRNSMRVKKNEQTYTKYKDSMYEISLLKCSLRKINITSYSSEDKYYIVPQNILNGIFNIKHEKKIFNTNFTDISLMAKYIGENSQSILSAKESNNISEEKKMIEKADIENDIDKYDLIKINSPKKESIDKIISRNQNTFNRLKTFQIIQSKDLLNDIEKETKKEEKVENKRDKLKAEKRLSNKYVFPEGITFARSEKKRVSITNSKELLKNRFENVKNDFLRRTLTLRKNS